MYCASIASFPGLPSFFEFILQAIKAGDKAGDEVNASTLLTDAHSKCITFCKFRDTLSLLFSFPEQICRSQAYP